jgi:hypothetical protein
MAVPIPIIARAMLWAMGAVATALGVALIRPGADKREEEPRKTGADYLAGHSESPYKEPGQPCQTVDGRSDLKGSWKREGDGA